MTIELPEAFSEIWLGNALGAVMVFAGATSLLRLSLLVVITVIANLGIFLAPAQDQINEVHIKPRTEMSAPEALANQLSSGLDSHAEPIRKQVDLVLVPVTITDPMDRIVMGLDSGNFHSMRANSSRRSDTSPPKMLPCPWAFCWT